MSSTDASYSPELLRAIKRKKREQMRDDPKMYMRYNWRHPNDPTRPYDFKNDTGEPLNYLLDEKSHLNPDEWGSINVLLMARGMLKTTSILGITQWMCDMFPQSEMFMTAPRQAQVQEFMGKFKDSLEDTDLIDRRVRDRQSHQKFKSKIRGDDGGVHTVFSHVKSQSAWDADEGMRGPHSHAGVIDEFQDVNEEAFTVFLEMIDQPIPGVDYFPTVFCIGTPKMKNSFFHKLWKKSNQRTWSKEDQEWVDKSDVGEFKADGFDGDGFTIKGWKVNQFNSPLHDPSTVEYKRADYPEKKFQNEVLANFYSSADELLRADDIKACLDDSMGFRNSRMFDDSLVVFSVDWGGGSDANASDTTFTVGEKVFQTDEDDSWKHYIIQHEFLDHDIGGQQEEQLVREYISRYDPDIVLVDEGFNGTRRESLQDDHFELVKGVGFGNVTPSEAIKWKTDDDDRELFATVDKTYSAESMVDAVKDGRFVLPEKDLSFGSENANGEKLISQLTATYKEYKTTQSGRKKMVVQADRNDDAFDTWVYQHIGGVRMQAGPQLTKFALGTRRGY